MAASLEQIRHSLAHLLAHAVQEEFPTTQFAIGPTIENGFYYDFLLPRPLTAEDLPKLEKRMKHLVKQGLPFSQVPADSDAAQVSLKDQPFKAELISDLKQEGATITFYQVGNFTDLCRGGHVENTKDIPLDGFALDTVAGAYWRGSEKNPMLTRIYGLAFGSKKELGDFLHQREEAAKRDHKKLGPELDLFFIDEEVGRGLPMWTPKGTTMKLELESFTRWLETKYGYEHVSTPYLGSEKLYQTSGHLTHFKANMYAPIDMDGDIFYLRPMACPHHIRMLLRQPISYRDLPIRYAEIADYNRYEKSGELMGMIRVRKFQLTDAHIFVAPEGLKEEFKKVCALIQEGMKTLGLAGIISYRFSKRDPHDKNKYYSDDAMWENAESVMKQALDEIGIAYAVADGEAAFYGPKLDIQAKNVNGKEDTLFTAQIDFLLPEKFDITYTDADGSKKRPVMIHRSAIGALERTFAFLIEHFAGVFPLWLSPIQVAVIPVGTRHAEPSAKLADELRAAGLRVQLDDANETVGNKIRKAAKMKIPYLIVLGDKELESKDLVIRQRGREELITLSKAGFLKRVHDAIAKRTLELP